MSSQEQADYNAALARLADADRQRAAALRAIQGDLDSLAGTKSYLEDQTDQKIVAGLQATVQQLLSGSAKNRADLLAGEQALRAQIAALSAHAKGRSQAAAAGLQALRAALDGVTGGEAAMKKNGAQGLAALEDQFAQGDSAFRSRMRGLGQQSDDDLGQLEAALKAWIGQFSNGAADVASAIRSSNATKSAALSGAMAEALAALSSAQQLQQKTGDFWTAGTNGLQTVGNSLVAAGKQQTGDTAQALAAIKAAAAKETSDFGAASRAEVAARTATDGSIYSAFITLGAALRALNTSVRDDDADTLAPSFARLRALQAAAAAAHNQVADVLANLSRQETELAAREAALRTARNSTLEGLDNGEQGIAQESNHGLQAAAAALRALTDESAAAEALFRVRMARERSILNALRKARVAKELQQLGATIAQSGAAQESQLATAAAANQQSLAAASADLSKMMDAQAAATVQATSDSEAETAVNGHGLAALQTAISGEVDDLLQRLNAVASTYRGDYAQLAATRASLAQSESAMEAQVAAVLAAKKSAEVGDVDGALGSAGADVRSDIHKDVAEVQGEVPPWAAGAGAQEQQLRSSVGAAAGAEAAQLAAEVAANSTVASSLYNSSEDLSDRLARVAGACASLAQ